MPRRRVDDGLQVGHSWVWTADAERRWVRAVRLLRTPETAEHGAQAQEERRAEHAGGGLRPGLDGSAGGAADD